MLIGRLMFSVFHHVLDVISVIFFQHVWYAIRVSFLWFGLIFGISYLFFLWAHQEYTVWVRKKLAIAIAQSWGFAFLLASAVIGLYEMIVDMMCKSAFFYGQESVLCQLSLSYSGVAVLLNSLTAITLLFSALFLSHYVGLILSEIHEKHIADLYGWLILFVSLLVGVFLWLINS